MSDDGPWYLAPRDPGEPPVKPFVTFSIRDPELALFARAMHARAALREALDRDEIRTVCGYQPRNFRNAVRALLTPDTRRPLPSRWSAV